MRTIKELTKEQLMEMPLIALRRLDIDTPQQQELVQEIVNLKLSDLPVQRPIYRRDIPDIQTPQEEARWQEIIKQREAKIRGQMEGTLSEEPVVAPEVPETPAEIAPVVPDESGMAQPTGEGDPVNITTGVSSMLTGKVDKRTKAYKNSLKA